MSTEVHTDNRYRVFVSRFWLQLILLPVILLLSFSLQAAPAFQQFFTQHSAVMLLIDPASGRIVDANPAASAFYGYDREKLLQMSIQQINTLTSEQVKSERQLADSQGRNFFIFRHRLANGETRKVSVFSYPFAFDGQTQLLSIIHDISPESIDSQAVWHYQQRLEEMVEKQVKEIEDAEQQRNLLMLGGLLTQGLVIALLVLSIQRRRHLQKALSNQKQSLANILWGTDAGTWEWNVKTGEAHLNERWAQTLGYTLEELEPVSIETWWRFAHPDDIGRSRETLQKHFVGELDAYQCEVRMRHKQGHWVWVLDRGKVVTWAEDGGPVWISGTHTDITEQKRSQESMLQAASVFEHANEGIMITDPNGTIMNANSAFSRITGYSNHEVIGKNPRIFSSGHHDKAYFEEMWKSLHEKGSWTNEVWNRRKSGEVFAAIQTVSAIKDQQDQVIRYVSLFSDITALKEQQRQLEQIAHYDALTGLPNRVLLSDRLHQAIAHAKRYNSLIAVAFFDLDGFKEVNDQHGHSTGDQLLVKLAKRAKRALRGGDSLARLGGDEFVAVLQDLGEFEDSVPVLDRLLRAISEPVYVQGTELQISASLGVTFYPQEENIDADQLIRQADQAMYIAKQSGKNRYHIFDTDHDRSVRGQHNRLLRIREALAENEFVLHYQPKVNMRSGEIIGTEALIRWQHPEQGLMPPAEFLPAIAGHPALEVELGEWVLDQAFSQISQWRQQGLALPVSVNIDAAHLQLPDFVERLRSRLEQNPLVEVGDLQLEVLETSALEDIERVSAIIRACRDIGVSFALDDFGTGYSSLTYLKRLPASLLKIDQSFVCDMLDDPEDLSILEGVLGLASAFRCQVIAEGVETEEQGKALLMMGCELAQGYAIARPMPAAEIASWAQTWCPCPSWPSSRVVSRDDLPFLFVMVQNRAWFAALAAFLNGSSEDRPAVSYDHCQFSEWLESISHHRFDGDQRLQDMVRLHQGIHDQAEALVAEHSQLSAGVLSERLEYLQKSCIELQHCARDMLE